MRTVIWLRQGLFWILSLGVAAASIRFLLLPEAEAFGHMVHQLAQAEAMFRLHVFASPIALALVPVQFWSRFRMRRPALHRWAGRLYVLAVVLGGVSGLLIAPNSMGGMSGHMGFGILAVAWLTATALALWHILGGRLALHRDWMIRSAAMTWAGVSLRLLIPWMAPIWGVHITFAVVAWACWVPNLLVAEWLIRRWHVESPQMRAP